MDAARVKLTDSHGAGQISARMGIVHNREQHLEISQHGTSESSMPVKSMSVYDPKQSETDFVVQSNYLVREAPTASSSRAFGDVTK